MPPELIQIDIKAQTLCVLERGLTLMCYRVSTAKNGAGERNGSGCTPRGWHTIRAKIGQDCASGAVFVSRRPTGEIFQPDYRRRYPQRDWILTRVLWLTGLEPGKNRYGEVDTLRRYIYIHGAPDDVARGEPGSHGCVRMRNADIIALFEHAYVGMRVLINE